MTGWVILVDQARDFPNADTPHKVITTRDYLARPKLFAGLGRAKIINLSRSYNYQSKGYYASLLAEARGHRVIPTVETMLDLRELKLYEQSLPELQEALTAGALKAHATEDTTFDLLFCFGFVQDPRFEAFGRLLFDWYRCPAIEVTITAGKRWKIDRLRARPLAKLGPDEAEFFHKSLHRHTQRDWRNPRGRAIARYSLAVLYDPQEDLPPSSLDTLKHFSRLAEKQSVEIELITRKQLAELVEFDGLFIRATTSIDSYTYRFAQRARSEGMPVIDDPQSMIRCTNKVYLHELLEAHGVPVPPTVMLAEDEDLAKAERLLGWPMVLKIRTARSRAGSTRSSPRRRSRRSRTNCSRTPTSCWRRSSCRQSSTGGSGCSTANRYSCASTRWRAATGRSSSTGRTDPGGRIEDDCRRRGSPAGHRRRAQSRPRHRPRPLWRRHQGNRRRDRRHRGQRQPQSRAWGRGPGWQRRDLDEAHQLVRQADRCLKRAPAARDVRFRTRGSPPGQSMAQSERRGGIHVP